MATLSELKDNLISAVNELAAAANGDSAMVGARVGKLKNCRKVSVCISGHESHSLNDTIEEILETIPYNRGFRVDELDYSCGFANLTLFFWSVAHADDAEAILSDMGAVTYVEVHEVCPEDRVRASTFGFTY